MRRVPHRLMLLTGCFCLLSGSWLSQPVAAQTTGINPNGSLPVDVNGTIQDVLWQQPIGSLLSSSTGLSGVGRVSGPVGGINPNGSLPVDVNGTIQATLNQGALTRPTFPDPIVTDLQRQLATIVSRGSPANSLSSSGTWGIFNASSGGSSLASAIDSFFGVLAQFGAPTTMDIVTNAQGALAGGRLGSVTPQGALGLPDPELVTDLINASATSPREEALGTKTGGLGSPVVKADAKVVFDADMAEEMAREAALTRTAQAQLAQNVAVAQTALEQSMQLSEDSETQDISQNILRNLSTQTALGQQTDTLLAIDAQRRQRDDATRNVVLSDALRELHQERVAERRMDAAAYSFAITHGSLLALPGWEPGR